MRLSKFEMNSEKCPICFQCFCTNRFYGILYSDIPEDVVQCYSNERQDAVIDKIQLSCNHIFHYECIYNIMDHNLPPHCPVCRSKFLQGEQLNVTVTNVVGDCIVHDMYPDLVFNYQLRNQFISLARGWFYMGILSLVTQYWLHLFTLIRSER
jgi:hypothetical protein